MSRFTMVHLAALIAMTSIGGGGAPAAAAAPENRNGGRWGWSRGPGWGRGTHGQNLCVGNRTRKRADQR